MPRICIIGAGFSGVCAAIKLHQAGYTDIVLYDKEEGVGGTWRKNTYPGAQCDVASPLYSYSFALNSEWPSKWSPQPAILAYIDRCVDRFGIRSKVQCNSLVTRAEFQEQTGDWLLTVNGRTESFRYVVFATGQLNRPKLPDLRGLESFEGPVFHSATWRHDVDLANKRIGVIGTAASAVQFIPKIAPDAERLAVFQRTANWVLPRPERDFSRLEQWIGARVPWFLKAHRALLWVAAEAGLYPLIAGNRTFAKLYEKEAKAHIDRTIDDPFLRQRLLPNYPVGAKRVLFSNDYYPTLNRPNVDLITSGIQEVLPHGVRTQDDNTHDLDILICATGFHSNGFMAPVDVVGRDATRLQDAWASGARAYLGISVPAFPNMFLMYGPNTNLSHNSIVLMSECQSAYIVSCVEQAERAGAKFVDVREAAERAFHEEVHARLAKTTWSKVRDSWYMSDGLITNNWPGRTTEYWWRTRRCDLGAYHVVMPS